MFRGFAVIDKKWVYGYYCVAENKDGQKQHQILEPDYFVGNHQMYVIEPDSVEECVRCKDIHNNELYEGDKVKVSNINTAIDIIATGTIVIHKGCASVKMQNEDDDTVVYQPLYEMDVELLERHGKYPLKRINL